MWKKRRWLKADLMKGAFLVVLAAVICLQAHYAVYSVQMGGNISFLGYALARYLPAGGKLSAIIFRGSIFALSLKMVRSRFTRLSKCDTATGYTAT